MFDTYIKQLTSKPLASSRKVTRKFETYVKLSTSNRIWNIRSIRVWALCRTSFSGYPVPLRAFELLNLVNSQPFSLIYRRRFLCLSSALLLACVFSQRLFAGPLLLRRTGWLQQSYSERLRPFSSYTVPFWAPIYLYYHRSDRSFEPIKSYTSIFSMPNTSVCAYVKLLTFKAPSVP